MPFDHFNFIAPFYNRIGTYSSLDIMVDAAALPTRGILLDAGGGTGRVASALLDQAAQIVVVDISLGMLRFAASKPGLRAAVAQSEHLPFSDSTFDRIIMVDAFHHVIHQADTARELLRLLRPGGRIVIEEPDIRIFGVKLIALGEKMLLMRSHFLAPDQIAALFAPVRVYILAKDSNAWIVVNK
jgi:demethylmenaquinone methyltransferase/2-methoxy-6-polyprenyl-1,4-benzoquinol methylase